MRRRTKITIPIQKEPNYFKMAGFALLGLITGPVVFVAKYVFELVRSVLKLLYKSAQKTLEFILPSALQPAWLAHDWAISWSDFRFVVAASLYMMLCFAVWKFVPSGGLLFLAVLFLSIPCFAGFAAGAGAEGGDVHAIDGSVLFAGGLVGALGVRTWQRWWFAFVQEDLETGLPEGVKIHDTLEVRPPAAPTASPAVSSDGEVANSDDEQSQRLAMELVD